MKTLIASLPARFRFGDSKVTRMPCLPYGIATDLSPPKAYTVGAVGVFAGCLAAC